MISTPTTAFAIFQAAFRHVEPKTSPGLSTTVVFCFLVLLCSCCDDDEEGRGRVPDFGVVNLVVTHDEFFALRAPFPHHPLSDSSIVSFCICTRQQQQHSFPQASLSLNYHHQPLSLAPTCTLFPRSYTTAFSLCSLASNATLPSRC